MCVTVSFPILFPDMKDVELRLGGISNLMRTALIFGIIILLAWCLYAGTRLTHHLTRPWLWRALVIILATYAILFRTQVSLWLISDFAVLLVALLVASTIGLTLKSSLALAAFCITAGIVDFYSFSGGLTAKIIADYAQGHRLLLQYLSITVPLSGQIVPIIGIGDLVFLGSVYYVLPQIGHHTWLTLLTPLVGLLGALIVGLLIGGIYAILFIGGATCVYLLCKVRTPSI
jgi:hypothetical protein